MADSLTHPLISIKICIGEHESDRVEMQNDGTGTRDVGNYIVRIFDRVGSKPHNAFRIVGWKRGAGLGVASLAALVLDELAMAHEWHLEQLTPEARQELLAKWGGTGTDHVYGGAFPDYSPLVDAWKAVKYEQLIEPGVKITLPAGCDVNGVTTAAPAPEEPTARDGGLAPGKKHAKREGRK